MAGKATIVAQVYSYTISNYAKERKKLQYINICLAIKIWRIVVIKWAGLWLGQLVLGHSNMINCFPFPARIILSHRMLSFIIWSCDQNFHYCNQLTEHAVLTTQNGDRERICCCQPSGLSFHEILAAHANRSTPFVTFSTNPYSCVFPACLNCHMFWCMLV